mgnify:CR=1 FL=1
MNTNRLRVLIVGQGLAGTVLAETLQNLGLDVFVLDSAERRGASMAAAGVINPITGKRFVKSWMLEELLPFAEVFYKKLGQKLGVDIWHPRNIIRILSTVKEENDWISRSSLLEYCDYLEECKNAADWSGLLQPGFRFGILRRAAQVDLTKMIALFKQKLIENGCFFEENFDFNAVEPVADGIFYKKEKFDKIIFCEGWQARENPFFKEIDCWNLAKGEALTVRIPSFSTDFMLKKNIMIAPLGGDVFWVGATTDWDFEDEKPTDLGKNWLLDALKKVLIVPFEVTGQLSGVRPTIFDKRPVMGFLDKNPAIGMFNGMGTKGTMLAPFWADVFAKHLAFGQTLPEIVDFRRNFNRKATPKTDI